jgi:Ser/Thr protein kinase RdoA (MazF antagonist)
LRTAEKGVGERPSVTEQAVRTVLAEAYGIEARLDRLAGENLNYLVTATSGRQYVAKIAGDQQPPVFVALENAALQHAAETGLPFDLPQIQENKFGNLETFIENSDSSSKRLRILKFIQGKAWSELTDISTELRFDLGQKLAQFDLAMRGFENPAAHRAHR